MFAFGILVIAFAGTMASIDLGPSIMNGTEACFTGTYASEEKLFQLTCLRLLWNEFYTNKHFISLQAGETFDGNCNCGTTGEHGVIDLTGVNGFPGLFATNDDDKSVTSFDQAPLIQNVHVVNGTTGDGGGFIVQSHQRFFVIDSCTSSGEIYGSHSGGLCGNFNGFDHGGHIKIVNSHSTGQITGWHASGITGNFLARNYGTANITNCYTTGDIYGRFAGGITGSYAAELSGQVFIFRCYSTGNMVVGFRNGGIAGEIPASQGGFMYIEECYSTGAIGTGASGGIAGGLSATSKGVLHITNCYSRGNVSGAHAGGITGRDTGGQHVPNRQPNGRWPSGDVFISNSYASGEVLIPQAGGIIGSINSKATGTIKVTNSVYNGNADTTLVGSDGISKLAENSTGNSNNLLDSQGRILDTWSDTVWSATDQFPILKFEQESLYEESKQSVTSTVSPTPVKTASPSPTPTQKQTHERVELPVQYPRRVVINKEND